MTTRPLDGYMIVHRRECVVVDTRMTAERLSVHFQELMTRPTSTIDQLGVVCKPGPGSIELHQDGVPTEFFYNINDPVQLVADALGGLTTMEHAERQNAEKAGTGLMVFRLVVRRLGLHKHIRIDQIVPNLPF